MGPTPDAAAPATDARAELADLVDFDVLALWMDREGLGTGPIGDVTRLAGGTQNVLVKFSRDGREYVLRRPPRHLRAASNDALRREARVLAALAGSAVPHPELIAACPDEDVLGVVFYLMEPVDGFNPTVRLPEPHRSDPAMRHRIGLSAMEAIAALGSVDVDAVGLSDFGRPEGFLDRQVPRWRAELDSYSELPGYPGPEIPGLERVGDWLAANLPPTWTPGIMHGDFHLANVMVRPDSGDLAAIVDWEMCTIGDPLVDLGWFIALWPGPGGTGSTVGPVMGMNGVDGWATADELVAHYAESSARPVEAIDWYVAYACFKCGIILEGTHARAAAGKADRATGDILHAITVALFEKALTITG